MNINCNRLVVNGDTLCAVKDTCEGCTIAPDKCAINDMLKKLGVLDSWAAWSMPDYRQRAGGAVNNVRDRDETV